MTRKSENIDPGKPISSWVEKDSLYGKVVDAKTIILLTRGCSWSRKIGCSMCGYTNDSIDLDLTYENIIDQIREGMKGGGYQSYIKIFTSGSFLDPKEMERRIALDTISFIHDKAPKSRILIESRPEYIDVKILKSMKKVHEDIEVAIGLEDTNDIIRSKLIRKGFSFDQYVEAGNKIKETGLSLKTYLLLKPPLLGEKYSLESTVGSIKVVHELFPGSCISINPVNIQSSTPVEDLFKKGLYRPPWLWTLLEVLRKGHGITKAKTRLMSSPTAGGKKRGAHNCGECDDEVLERIRYFSLENSINHLTTERNCCRNEWLSYLKGSCFDPTL